tara:strand:- start:683 stop:853 length:171 start_codon:yes stop_codon:yes gene_type:complete
MQERSLINMNKKEQSEFLHQVALPMVGVASTVILAALWCDILIKLDKINIVIGGIL